MTKKNRLPKLFITIKNGLILISSEDIEKEYNYYELIKESYKNPYANYLKIEKVLDIYTTGISNKRLKKAVIMQKLDVPVLYAIIDFIKLNGNKELVYNLGNYISSYAKQMGIKGIKTYGTKISLQYVLNQQNLLNDYYYYYQWDKAEVNGKETTITEHKINHLKKIGILKKIQILFARKLTWFNQWIKKIKDNKKVNEQNAYDNNEIDKEKINIENNTENIEYKKMLDVLDKIEECEKEKVREQFELEYDRTEFNRKTIKDSLMFILEFVRKNKEGLKKDSKKIYRAINDGELTQCMDDLLGTNGIIKNGKEIFETSPKIFFKALKKENFEENFSEYDNEIIFYIFLQKLLIEIIKNKKDIQEDNLKEYIRNALWLIEVKSEDELLEDPENIIEK